MRGRISVRGKAFVDAGGGVAVGPRTVLTAAHVVEGCRAADVLFRTGSGSYPVVAFRYSQDLDAAVLELDGDVPSFARVAHAWPGDRWETSLPPTPRDPNLSGVIDFPERVFVNSRGRPTYAQQLRVDQEVKDYHAYSGSAVTVPKVRDAVVGILIEQQDERLVDLQSAVVPATNVLYAVPAARIVTGFALDVPVHRDSLNHSALEIRILRDIHHHHWLSHQDVSAHVGTNVRSVIARLVAEGLLAPGSYVPPLPAGRVRFGTPKNPDHVPPGAFSVTAKGVRVLRAVKDAAQQDER